MASGPLVLSHGGLGHMQQAREINKPLGGARKIKPAAPATTACRSLKIGYITFHGVRPLAVGALLL